MSLSAASPPLAIIPLPGSPSFPRYQESETLGSTSLQSVGHRIRVTTHGRNQEQVYSLRELEQEARGRSTLEALTSDLDPVTRLVHEKGESLVQVGHMLQALVYTAHISNTFPTKLQHVWKPPPELLKVGTGTLPGQYSPSYTGDNIGFNGVSGRLPKDVRSRSVEVLKRKMSEIEGKVKRTQASVPYLAMGPFHKAPSEPRRRARTLLPCRTLNLATQVEDVTIKKGLLVDIISDILPHLEGLVVRLWSTTRALSAISAALG